MFNVRRELIANLRTKDPDEAKERTSTALPELRAKLEAVRAAYEGREADVSEREAHALAGAWYRAETARWADNPGTEEHWDNEQWGLINQTEDVPRPDAHPADPDGSDKIIVPSEVDKQDAARLLADAGLRTTRPAIDRVAQVLWEARWRLTETMLRRVRGDWGPDRNKKLFPPPLPPKEPAQSAPEAGLTFDGLLEGWARDQGWTLDAKPEPRPLYDRRRTLERLAAFVGHRDADRVSKADAVRWKEDMKARDLKVPTIRNDLSEMSASMEARGPQWETASICQSI